MDFSNTLAARDRSFLSKLRNLPLLQVLRLRRVNLRDEDLEVLTEAIGIRVRSLDVQGNHLTDHAVRLLLNTCFLIKPNANDGTGGRARASSNLTLEDWPSGFLRPDHAVLDEFRDESYDERFVRRLTSGVVSRLPFEDMPQSGITHLYISENNLSVEGLAALFRSTKLHVLDAGSVNFARVMSRHHPELSPSLSPFETRGIRLPGVEKLIPLCGRNAQNMTSLRLHHAIITEKAPADDSNAIQPVCELGVEDAKQELELPEPSDLVTARQELYATPPVYELENKGPETRYELPGDSTHFLLSPPVGEKPRLSKEESQPVFRRESVFAPEVINQGDSENDAAPMLTANGLRSTAQSVNGVRGLFLSTSTDGMTASPGTSNVTAEIRLALIQRQRHDLRSSQLRKPHGLVPGMLPKLRKITLTNIPPSEKDRHVTDALINFIKACSAEAELATLQAHSMLDPLNQPGQRRLTHVHRKSQEIFSLRCIVLEIAPSTPVIDSNTARSLTAANWTKSSTEDPDSEALWSAASNDFTFFDDGEECGLPAAETGTHVHYSALSEKITMPEYGSKDFDLPTLQHSTGKASLIDVVQEIATFRRERKQSSEIAAKAGVRHVEGYWPGEVKVVRGDRPDGEMDYYGNNFHKGGVYR